MPEVVSLEPNTMITTIANTFITCKYVVCNLLCIYYMYVEYANAKSTY
jgi:hypothetical protein